MVLFVAVVLAGVTILSGSVQAGVGLAVAPVIGQHIPSISGFTYILFGVGIVTVGRNPYGMGQFYAEVGTFWNRRRAGPRRTTGTGSPPTGATGRAAGRAGALRWLTASPPSAAAPRWSSRRSRSASAASRPSMTSTSRCRPARSTA